MWLHYGFPIFLSADMSLSGASPVVYYAKNLPDSRTRRIATYLSLALVASREQNVASISLYQCSNPFHKQCQEAGSRPPGSPRLLPPDSLMCPGGVGRDHLACCHIYVCFAYKGEGRRHWRKPVSLVQNNHVFHTHSSHGVCGPFYLARRHLGQVAST